MRSRRTMSAESLGPEELAFRLGRDLILLRFDTEYCSKRRAEPEEDEPYDDDDADLEAADGIPSGIAERVGDINFSVEQLNEQLEGHVEADASNSLLEFA